MQSFSEASSTAKILLIPGPIEVDKSVLVNESAVSHVDPAFIKKFGDSIRMLRRLVLSDDAQPFIITASGSLGWEIFTNNFIDGHKTLIVSQGYFGRSFQEVFETVGLPHEYLFSGFGKIPSVDEVLRAMEINKCTAVTFTHVDTSTGIRCNLDKYVGPIRQKFPNAIIAVDGVCSIGGEVLDMSKTDVDFVMTGSQKAIGALAGLSICWASRRAMAVLENKKSIPSYYSNMKRWLPIHNAYEQGKPSYYCTPAVNTIISLESALRVVFNLNKTDDIPSLEAARTIMTKRWQDHQDTADMFRKTINESGLKLIAESEDIAANTLSAVYSAPSSLPKIIGLSKDNGFIIAGGLLKEVDPYFRVGHMGQSIYLGHVLKYAQILAKILK